MREIKFRAWDKQKKVMVTDFVLAPTSPSWGAFPIERAKWLEEYQKIIHEKIGIIDEDWKMRLLGFITSDYTLTDWSNYYGLEEYEIMQFTSLKDKDGKEIWEGDVVSVDRQDSFPSFNKAIIRYAENHGSFLLQYTKEATPRGILSRESISSKDGKTIFGYCTGWKLEVIGNIYENPELLEAVNQ